MQPDDSTVNPMNCLDGATFEVLVHRIQNPNDARGGPWLIRVYQGADHIHSAEGGVTLEAGLREAHAAMLHWLDRNGGGPRPVPAPADDQMELPAS